MAKIVSCPLGSNCLFGRKKHLYGSFAYQECADSGSRTQSSTADNLSSLRSELSSVNDSFAVPDEEIDRDTLVEDMDLSEYTKDDPFLYHESDDDDYSQDKPLKVHLYRNEDGEVVYEQEWLIGTAEYLMGQQCLEEQYDVSPIVAGKYREGSRVYDDFCGRATEMMWDNLTRENEFEKEEYYISAEIMKNGDETQDVFPVVKVSVVESGIETNRHTRDKTLGLLEDFVNGSEAVRCIKPDDRKRWSTTMGSMSKLMIRGFSAFLAAGEGLEKSPYAEQRQMTGWDLDQVYHLTNRKHGDEVDVNVHRVRAQAEHVEWIGDEVEMERYRDRDDITVHQVDTGAFIAMNNRW